MMCEGAARLVTSQSVTLHDARGKLRMEECSDVKSVEVTGKEGEVGKEEST